MAMVSWMLRKLLLTLRLRKRLKLSDRRVKGLAKPAPLFLDKNSSLQILNHIVFL